jgi:hypothetical protein
MVTNNSCFDDIILTDPISLKTPYAWVGHIPFAFWLIKYLEPSVFVELGTHTGNSYFAFCQAVDLCKKDTQCFAVDTWKGDEHAGYYEDAIYQNVNKHNEEYYSNFSRLLPMLFDNALDKFEEASIDLLHIDGLHTYEAVKHDFEAWLPKMSNKGVIIFHDICVKERNFGVWKLWEELKDKYPFFSFEHSYGLGLIVVGKKILPSVNNLCTQNSENIKNIQKLFQKISESYLYEETISQLEHLANEHTQTQRLVAERDAQLAERDAQLAEVYSSTSWRITAPIRSIRRKQLKASHFISMLLRSRK